MRTKCEGHVQTLLNDIVEPAHAAGVLRGPENLYEDAIKVIQSNVNRLVPASKSETQDVEAKVEQLEEFKAESEVYKAESEKNKAETAAIINNLISKVNSLTPVSLELPLEL